jgi:cbb3-type cytochrome oxidase maturation protein
MNILFVLIPLSLVLLGIAVWSLFWAVDTGQFDNLDEAARAWENDDVPPPAQR